MLSIKRDNEISLKKKSFYLTLYELRFTMYLRRLSYTILNKKKLKMASVHQKEKQK